MKTLNFKKTNEFFAEFELTCNEMTKVRGGDGIIDPIIKPPIPPVKI
jgi:hypothetical protein